MSESEKMYRVSDSMVTNIHLVRQADLNGAGRLFGGILMQWIDETAGLVGLRHARMNVTTAAVENLQFLRGAYANDRVMVVGRMIYVGNTSMVVKVETFVEAMDGTLEQINQAYLTMVALDSSDRPARVPRLKLETAEEKAEWDKAERRKEIKQRQAEHGFSFY